MAYHISAQFSGLSKLIAISTPSLQSTCSNQLYRWSLIEAISLEALNLPINLVDPRTTLHVTLKTVQFGSSSDVTAMHEYDCEGMSTWTDSLRRLRKPLKPRLWRYRSLDRAVRPHLIRTLGYGTWGRRRFGWRMGFV